MSPPELKPKDKQPAAHSLPPAFQIILKGPSPRHDSMARLTKIKTGATLISRQEEIVLIEDPRSVYSHIMNRLQEMRASL